MADITELLNYIKTRVYGKDVRQAIHDAIRQCYLDGKVGAIDMVARNQISNLVAENNNTSGNSELTDIRVGADGTKYTSAGEAVRTQIKNVSASQEEIQTQVPVLADHMSSARERMTYTRADMRFFSYGSINSSGTIVDSQKEIVSVFYGRRKDTGITPPDGYEMRISTYRAHDLKLQRLDEWASSGATYGADNDSLKDRVSFRRKDGGNISLTDLEGAIYTTIPELKIFYNIAAALDSLKKELETKIASVSNKVAAVESDLDAAPDDIINLHVWEKFSSSLKATLGATQEYKFGSWPSGIPGLDPDFTINYSAGIGKLGNEIILADPVSSFHVTKYSDYKKLDFLRGKYVKKADSTAKDGCFKVAANATFTVTAEKNTIEYYVMKCSSAQHVDSVGYTESYGHIASADRNAYPDVGVKDDFYYEYRGTIGQALTKISSID